MDWFDKMAGTKEQKFNVVGRKLISELQKGDKVVFECGDFNKFISMEIDNVVGWHVFGTVLSTDLNITSVGKYDDFDFGSNEYLNILEA